MALHHAPRLSHRSNGPWSWLRTACPANAHVRKTRIACGTAWLRRRRRQARSVNPQSHLALAFPLYCPLQATLFATLMSIVNSGSIMGGALGAGLTKLYGVTSDRFDNLFALVTTCIALNLVPAAFLRMLPEQVDREREEGSQGHGQAQSGAGGGPGEVRMAEGSGSGKGRHESEAMEAGLAGPGPGSGGEERAPLLGGKVARD